MPAQAAGLSFSHFLQKKFEFQRTKEPNEKDVQPHASFIWLSALVY